MGQSKSKALKYPHHPLPPGYPQYYPYAAPPPVGYIPGYHGPQPVIPPGYGGPMTMPQPQIAGWPPQEYRRKKKRRSSAPPAARPADQLRTAANVQPAPAGMLDNLPLGFIPTNITPNPPGGPGRGRVIPSAVPGNNTAQGAYPPPLFTPGVPGNAQLNDLPSSEPLTQRRAATPFVPHLARNDGSDDDDDESGEHGGHHGRPHFQSHQRAASVPYASQLISPDDPIASPGVRPNPLPQPPRDLYELSPYKQLLHLPNTMALLTATTTNPQNVTVYPTQDATVTRSGTNPGMAGVGAGTNAMQQPAVKKKKKGFFSFGSRRGRHPPVQPAQSQPQPHQLGNIQFVPIYQNTPQPQPPAPGHLAAPAVAQPHAGPSTGEGRMQHQGGTPVPPVPTPPSPEPQRSPPPDDYDEISDDDGAVPPAVYRSISPTPHQHLRAVHNRHSQPHPQQQPQPQAQAIYQPQPQNHPQPQPQYQLSQPPPGSQQPYLVSPGGSTLEFSHSSLPDFLNHSSHRVMYANKIYPSAMHLHEAMKFLDHKPDLAESVRMCENVEDVYPLTGKLQVWVRPDWGTVFLDKMEEVLYHKFTQHQGIRTMLLKTGNAKIVYSDPQDPYWGSGAPFGSGRYYPGTNYLGTLLEKVRERLQGYSV